MSRMFVVAVVLLLLGLAAVQQLETVGQAPAVAAAAKAGPTVNSGNSRTTVIKARLGGQFEVDTFVEGRRVVMVVDTGASHITLRASDAARASHYPSLRDYSIALKTANGEAKAARVDLNKVEIGDIVVRDLPALILPDEILPVNLLGMSFLSRVRWSHERGQLVLEQ